eukprot:TRINITY_DN7791_c0_g1_i3.p1 TRINITY_DN7791_c0_g1~~TRINITY_DN7791_c0_g1_i3.p1  ORF type:complete len:226 (+),score=30.27 TRINITY_DN7791_c0_g1_i3:143-820(+)
MSRNNRSNLFLFTLLLACSATICVFAQHGIPLEQLDPHFEEPLLRSEYFTFKGNYKVVNDSKTCDELQCCCPKGLVKIQEVDSQNITYVFRYESFEGKKCTDDELTKLTTRLVVGVYRKSYRYRNRTGDQELTTEYKRTAERLIIQKLYRPVCSYDLLWIKNAITLNAFGFFVVVLGLLLWQRKEWRRTAATYFDEQQQKKQCTILVCVSLVFHRFEDFQFRYNS